jgi:hypothetical protein
MTKSDDLPIASAYAVVPTKEEVELADVVQTADSRLDLNQPLGSGVSPQFADISEARGLTWRDDFFDDEEDVVAVFDFDYGSMECHYKCLSWGALGGAAFCFPGFIFPFALFGLVPCFLNKNVKWNVRAQHVCVTRDGILFVHDQRPTLWGEHCSAGKRMKTIPFDQITDCTMTDVGSATCVLGTALSSVEIDTPSSGNNNKHDLRIVGLENPRAFQKLVLAMKRQGNQSSVLPLAMDRIDRSLAQTDSEGGDVSNLLREIRDELRQNNKMLQSMKVPAHKD